MSYQYSEDPEEQLPEWLKALRKEQKQAEPEETTGPDSQNLEGNALDEEVEMKPGNQPESGEETSPLPEEEAEPDWLKDIRERHQLDQEHESSTAHAPAEDLSDTQPQVVEPETIDEQMAETAVHQSMEEAEEMSVAADEQSEIAPGEIPGWLEALRPSGIGEDANQSQRTERESVEGEGPLSGLSDVLPLVDEIAQAGGLYGESRSLEISASQAQHSAALEAMISSEEKTLSAHKEKATSSKTRIGWLVFFGMVLASLIPLFFRAEAEYPSGDSLGASREFFEEIEGLQSSAPVLIAFEIQPGQFAEIQSIAKSAIGHLQEMEAEIHFLSTFPSGPALADLLMEQEFDKGNPYINLGYLSGGTAALRQLASSASDSSLFSSLTENENLSEGRGLAYFDLILVVSGGAEDARIWIEQVGPQFERSLLVASSAQAGPVLRTYLDTEPSTLDGLVVGWQGAAFYESLSGGAGFNRILWNSFSQVLGAAIFLTLLFGLFGRYRANRDSIGKGIQREVPSNG